MHPIPLIFLIYEENFIYFFISVEMDKGGGGQYPVLRDMNLNRQVIAVHGRVVRQKPNKTITIYLNRLENRLVYPFKDL